MNSFRFLKSSNLIFRSVFLAATINLFCGFSQARPDTLTGLALEFDNFKKKFSDEPALLDWANQLYNVWGDDTVEGSCQYSLIGQNADTPGLVTAANFGVDIPSPYSLGKADPAGGSIPNPDGVMSLKTLVANRPYYDPNSSSPLENDLLIKAARDQLKKLIIKLVTNADVAESYGLGDFLIDPETEFDSTSIVNTAIAAYRAPGSTIMEDYENAKMGLDLLNLLKTAQSNPARVRRMTSSMAAFISSLSNKKVTFELFEGSDSSQKSSGCFLEIIGGKFKKTAMSPVTDTAQFSIVVDQAQPDMVRIKNGSNFLTVTPLDKKLIYNNSYTDQGKKDATTVRLAPMITATDGTQNNQLFSLVAVDADKGLYALSNANFRNSFLGVGENDFVRAQDPTQPPSEGLIPGYSADKKSVVLIQVVSPVYATLNDLRNRTSPADRIAGYLSVLDNSSSLLQTMPQTRAFLREIWSPVADEYSFLTDVKMAVAINKDQNKAAIRTSMQRLFSKIDASLRLSDDTEINELAALNDPQSPVETMTYSSWKAKANEKFDKIMSSTLDETSFKTLIYPEKISNLVSRLSWTTASTIKQFIIDLISILEVDSSDATLDTILKEKLSSATVNTVNLPMVQLFTDDATKLKTLISNTLKFDPFIAAARTASGDDLARFNLIKDYGPAGAKQRFIDSFADFATFLSASQDKSGNYIDPANNRRLVLIDLIYDLANPLTPGVFDKARQDFFVKKVNRIIEQKSQFSSLSSGLLEVTTEDLREVIEQALVNKFTDKAAIDSLNAAISVLTKTSATIYSQLKTMAEKIKWMTDNIDYISSADMAKDYLNNFYSMVLERYRATKEQLEMIKSQSNQLEYNGALSSFIDGANNTFIESPNKQYNSGLKGKTIREVIELIKLTAAQAIPYAEIFNDIKSIADDLAAKNQISADEVRDAAKAVGVLVANADATVNSLKDLLAVIRKIQANFRYVVGSTSSDTAQWVSLGSVCDKAITEKQTAQANKSTFAIKLQDCWDKVNSINDQTRATDIEAMLLVVWDLVRSRLNVSNSSEAQQLKDLVNLVLANPFITKAMDSSPSIQGPDGDQIVLVKDSVDQNGNKVVGKPAIAVYLERLSSEFNAPATFREWSNNVNFLAEQVTKGVSKLQALLDAITKTIEVMRDVSDPGKLRAIVQNLFKQQAFSSQINAFQPILKAISDKEAAINKAITSGPVIPDWSATGVAALSFSEKLKDLLSRERTPAQPTGNADDPAYKAAKSAYERSLSQKTDEYSKNLVATVGSIEEAASDAEMQQLMDLLGRIRYYDSFQASNSPLSQAWFDQTIAQLGTGPELNKIIAFISVKQKEMFTNYMNNKIIDDVAMNLMIFKLTQAKQMIDVRRATTDIGSIDALTSTIKAVASGPMSIKKTQLDSLAQELVDLKKAIQTATTGAPTFAKELDNLQAMIIACAKEKANPEQKASQFTDKVNSLINDRLGEALRTERDDLKNPNSFISKINSAKGITSIRNFKQFDATAVINKINNGPTLVQVSDSLTKILQMDSLTTREVTLVKEHAKWIVDNFDKYAMSGPNGTASKTALTAIAMIRDTLGSIVDVQLRPASTSSSSIKKSDIDTVMASIGLINTSLQKYDATSSGKDNWTSVQELSDSILSNDLSGQDTKTWDNFVKDVQAFTSLITYALSKQIKDVVGYLSNQETKVNGKGIKILNTRAFTLSANDRKTRSAQLTTFVTALNKPIKFEDRLGALLELSNQTDDSMSGFSVAFAGSAATQTSVATTGYVGDVFTSDNISYAVSNNVPMDDMTSPLENFLAYIETSASTDPSTGKYTFDDPDRQWQYDTVNDLIETISQRYSTAAHGNLSNIDLINSYYDSIRTAKDKQTLDSLLNWDGAVHNFVKTRASFTSEDKRTFQTKFQVLLSAPWDIKNAISSSQKAEYFERIKTYSAIVSLDVDNAARIDWLKIAVYGATTGNNLSANSKKLDDQEKSLLVRFASELAQPENSKQLNSDVLQECADVLWSAYGSTAKSTANEDLASNATLIGNLSKQHSKALSFAIILARLTFVKSALVSKDMFDKYVLETSSSKPSFVDSSAKGLRVSAKEAINAYFKEATDSERNAMISILTEIKTGNPLASNNLTTIGEMLDALSLTKNVVKFDDIKDFLCTEFSCDPSTGKQISGKAQNVDLISTDRGPDRVALVLAKVAQAMGLVNATTDSTKSDKATKLKEILSVIRAHPKFAASQTTLDQNITTLGSFVSSPSNPSVGSVAPAGGDFLTLFNAGKAGDPSKYDAALTLLQTNAAAQKANPSVQIYSDQTWSDYVSKLVYVLAPGGTDAWMTSKGSLAAKNALCVEQLTPLIGLIKEVIINGATTSATDPKRMICTNLDNSTAAQLSVIQVSLV